MRISRAPVALAGRTAFFALLSSSLILFDSCCNSCFKYESSSCPVGAIVKRRQSMNDTLSDKKLAKLVERVGRVERRFVDTEHVERQLPVDPNLPCCQVNLLANCNFQLRAIIITIAWTSSRAQSEIPELEAHEITGRLLPCIPPVIHESSPSPRSRVIESTFQCTERPALL